jgi:hypothetical protein
MVDILHRFSDNHCQLEFEWFVSQYPEGIPKRPPSHAKVAVRSNFLWEIPP